MARIVDRCTYQFPTWMITYFANADASGLTDEDIELCHKADLELQEWAEAHNGWYSINWSGMDNQDPYFTYQSDFCNLGTDVYDLEVVIFYEDEDECEASL